MQRYVALGQALLAPEAGSLAMVFSLTAIHVLLGLLVRARFKIAQPAVGASYGGGASRAIDLRNR